MDQVAFGSRDYMVFLLLLMFSRGMDFLSTWIATPNLILEANPIARSLRWRWGIAVNLAMCFLFALWPLTAIIICTTSVLVAARNFQLAWLMRTHGEDNYRTWFVERMEETPPGLFLFCLLAQTILVAAVGGVLMYFSLQQSMVPYLGKFEHLVPLGIGMGIVGYAVAVTIYTLIGLWRRRRYSRFR